MPSHVQNARTALTLALTLAAAGPLASCGDGSAAGATKSRPAAPQPPATSVTLAPVVLRPAERTVEVTGTLLGQEEAAISAKVPGRITTIYHDLGDVVAPAAPLARIDPRDFELALAERRALAAAALAKLGLTELPDERPGEAFDASDLPTVRRAHAEAANAQARFDRATQLFEQSPPLISAQDFADLQTARDVARSQAEVEQLTARATLAEARAQAAAVEVAHQRLRDAVITAPAPPRPDAPALRYRVAQRLINTGEYVTEGRVLFRLVATDVLKLRAQVPERYAVAIKPDQPAHVLIESVSSPISGRVARVSPAVDPSSRTFAVEIEIDNRDAEFKPGAFARARIVTAVDPSVAFVPASAVVSFAGVDRVFSIADGKAVEHRVTLGRRDGDLVEIVGGLPVDRVIAAEAAGLVAGAPVASSQSPTDAPAR